MKNKVNDILKIGLVVLLLISLFNMPYEYYELLRFILIATFAWFVISEYVPNKFGWSFLYGTLVILFNPFLKLKIGAIGWKVVDFSTAVILVINLIEGKNRVNILVTKLRGVEFKKYFYYVTNNKNKRIFKRISITIIFIIIAFYVYRYFENIQTQRKIANEEKIRNHIQDSINQVNKTADSLIAIQNKIIRESNRILICNENKALEVFKSYLDFDHPIWKTITKPKIKKVGDCTFRISVLVRNIQYTTISQKETLIVEIEFISDELYKKYYLTNIEDPF